MPFTSIETVEQLKHLMLYADQNRQVENKVCGRQGDLTVSISLAAIWCAIDLLSV